MNEQLEFWVNVLNDDDGLIECLGRCSYEGDARAIQSRNIMLRAGQPGRVVLQDGDGGELPALPLFPISNRRAEPLQDG